MNPLLLGLTKLWKSTFMHKLILILLEMLHEHGRTG